MFALLLPSMVSAEYVAERLYCEDGPSSRVVEVLYEDQNSVLPCTISEQKLGQPSTVLWRAQNQINFCVDQLNVYREKLLAAGLECELLSGSDKLPQFNSRKLSSKMPDTPLVAPKELQTAESIVWTVTTARLQGEEQLSEEVGESASPGAQVIKLPYLTDNQLGSGGLVADADAWSDFTLESESQLLSNTENNFIDPEESLDSWVIFVSAKTLASIKTLLTDEPDVFEDYLLYEQQNAQTIYAKLQLRIHHLAEIAYAQKGATQ